ncbi:MAG: glycosyltransferase family 4 protein [Verrucomicrobia bacterium]|nr:glycosyltransferase family 4 protein [Verrucomicrobiota bacterium]
MKLALIRRQFSASGGAELYLQRLLEALAGAGHELHLFAEKWDTVPAGVTFHSIAGGGSRAARPLNFARAVEAALAAEKFDCVFSLERTLRQNVYRAGDGVHHVWLEQRRKFAPWWKRPFIGHGAFHRTMLALEAQTFDPRRTRRVIVNSEMVRAEILRHFNFPAERIHLVRNGVNVARFRAGRRAETRARFGVRDDEFLLLFAGSGWERKGLPALLKALPKISAASNGRRVKLLVAGKGRATAAPADVIFAGPFADVENAYAAADLFVFPPIYEPSANVVFEALAAGLPVITTACNGASEVLVEGVNGTVLHEPDNVPALADAVCAWMTRPVTRPVPNTFDLSLERNVAETIAVIELAAKEKLAGIRN